MKTLIVDKPFPYDGIPRKKGDTVEMLNSHAVLFCKLGKAHEITVEEKSTPSVARRDMRAEDETASSNTLSLPRGRGRGRYLRSDMRAEK